MAINNTTDEIMNDNDYIVAVQKFGKKMAQNMASNSFYDVNPNILANPDLAIRGADAYSSLGGKAATSQNPWEKYALAEGADKLTGGKDFMSMQGAFGGTGYTGWVTPAIGAASAIGKTVLGYKQLQAEKENNKEKLRLMEEANFMKKLKMKNQVNQANRYTALGMGNSNSQTATMRAVNSTPYTSMGL